MNALETTPTSQSPSNEKAPSLPAGFAELRKEINAQVEKPLAERFAKKPKELAWLLNVSDEMLETFIKNFPAENDGRSVEDADIEKYKRGVIQRRAQTLLESELMELLEKFSLTPPKNENPSGGMVDKPFKCANQNCLETEDLVRGVYQGYDPENLSGDHFHITQQKTGDGTQTDVLLIDAEGHGGEAKPLALLTASFVEAAEKEKLENPLILLDGFISSLPLNRSEISLQRARIESRDGVNGNDTKTLSLIQAGEAYAFWLEGNKETGWKMKIIMPESNEKHEAIDALELEEGSQMENIGYGTFERTAKKLGIVPHAQTFSLPKDAGLFFSSDGLFEAKNPKNGERVVEELPKIMARLLKDSAGKERSELEEALFQEMKNIAETYTQTDDETFLKIAA